jgi:RIO kinase 1
MKATDITELYEELDESGVQYRGYSVKHRGRFVSRTTSTRIQDFITKESDSRASFNFTYQAARFEEGWLLESLGYLYEQKWISDVLRKIKVGKEASVYLCRSGAHIDAPLVAAKVYRPRMLRSLRKDFMYREGRAVLDEDSNEIRDLGMLKAQHNRTMYGEEIRLQDWIAHEFTALQELFDAGGDVPHPYEMTEKAILMGYIGDENFAAPLLSEVTLELDEAAELFPRVLHTINLLLTTGWVHGDLSAYNILYWQGDFALIDFPQVIPVDGNRNAFAIFQRDMARLCEYFNDQGLSLQPRILAEEFWRAYGHHLHPEIHPSLLEAGDQRDRQVWEEQKNS